MNRRQFFLDAACGVAKWSPMLGLLGFRFVPLHQPQVIYGVLCRGYVEFLGRFVCWAK